MDIENKNEEDFKDFDDISDSLILDSDIAAFDEDAIENALKKITTQMSDENSEFESSDFQTNQELVEKQIKENTIEEEIPVQDSVEQENDIAQIEEELPVENQIKEDAIEEEIPVQDSVEQENDITQIEEENNIQDNKETIDTIKQEKEMQSSEQKEVLPAQKDEELSEWEEYNSANDVIKKYIVYISKDFVPYIDNLSTDERSAYINDAIQLKLDIQNEHKKFVNKRNAVIHFVLSIFIIIALAPLGIMFAHKAIMATFENYKYSQENFEKLYKHRFEKDKAFMESLQYNEAYRKKIKESAK